MSRWPDDPATLLGVGEEVSRRDLKRAYTRLIKRFKPEHAPDQFRRLREAYEQLDQQLEWREFYQSHFAQQRDTNGDDADQGGSENEDAATGTVAPVIFIRGGDAASIPDKPRDSTPRSEKLPIEDDARDDEPSRARGSSSGGDQLWQHALDGGDLQQIYVRLVESAKQRPPTEIGYARLYWLLTIHPEFDADRDPCAWLVEGFRKHGLNGRLLSMFITEVQRRSGHVPLAVTEELFDGNEPANRLVDLVQSRWSVARTLSRFDVIGADVERLRTRLLDEPEEWQRLLCGAVRQLVMRGGKRATSLLQTVCAELTGQPASVTSNWLWDWFDSTIALHQAWVDGSQRFSNKKEIVPTEGERRILSRLGTLVEATWECSPWQARADVLAFCAALMADPRTSLDELITITNVARPLVGRLLELLRDQRSEFGHDEDGQITPAAEHELHRFVDGELMTTVGSCHFAVLTFCLCEAVTPYDVATAIEKLDDPPHHLIQLAETLRSHLPLLCLVEAQSVLW